MRESRRDGTFPSIRRTRCRGERWRSPDPSTSSVGQNSRQLLKDGNNLEFLVILTRHLDGALDEFMSAALAAKIRGQGAAQAAAS